MKLTDRGVVFEGYLGVSPSTGHCSFTDKDGATLLIEATTLVRMYEIVKFDLERRGGWQAVISELEMTNRQARIKLLKAAFQKAEELMNEGYVVQWDDEVVEKVIFKEDSLLLETNFENFIHRTTIYDSRDSTDYADMTIDFIGATLKERLTVWKRVEIEF